MFFVRIFRIRNFVVDATIFHFGLGPSVSLSRSFARSRSADASCLVCASVCAQTPQFILSIFFHFRHIFRTSRHSNIGWHAPCMCVSVVTSVCIAVCVCTSLFHLFVGRREWIGCTQHNTEKKTFFHSRSSAWKLENKSIAAICILCTLDVCVRLGLLISFSISVCCPVSLRVTMGELCCAGHIWFYAIFVSA